MPVSEVNPSTLIELFIQRCKFCSTIYDFTGDTVSKNSNVKHLKALEAKNTKREYLLELIDLFDEDQ